MPILEFKEVTKSFVGLKAVDDLSFALNKNEVLFIIGPNGAGKTTLFNLINGFLHPDKGSICFDGRDISRLAPHQVAKLGIGRTFQIVKPLNNLTVLENVMLGAFLHTNSATEARKQAKEVLDFLSMQSWANQPARGLPLSTLKRLEIARALAMRPQLILLDEVVAGLPTNEAKDFASLLLKQLRSWGMTTVGGVEHVIPVVKSFADRVIVLNEGKKIAEGKPQSVMEDPTVIEVYLGLKHEEVCQ